MLLSDDTLLMRERGETGSQVEKAATTKRERKRGCERLQNAEAERRGKAKGELDARISSSSSGMCRIS